MSTWSKLRELTVAEFFTLCFLWFYLLLVVALLRCMGLKSTHRICRAMARFLKKLSHRLDGAPQREFVLAQHGARLVSIAAVWHFANVTCLPRSIALQAMLACQGIDSDLCVGVASDEVAGFHAHAWVEIRKWPVNDADNVATRFSSITRM